MTQPTIAQLRNLTDRAGGGLTADEQARLRDGIDHLAHATDGELRRQLADTIRALGKAETELADARALRDRWVKAGPPPLGTPISRWWDRRLAELGAALGQGSRVEEARLAQAGIDTPGCDCGHDGMGVSWHGDDCLWRRGVVDCPGRELPGPAAHNDGPSVEECRDADRRWPLQKTGE